MALPAANLVQAAIEQVFAAAADDKTREGSRSIALALSDMCGSLNRLYSTKLGADITVTDSADASVAAFLAGEGAAYAAGDIFRVLGTGDFTDNALATAKGSAVAAGDVFVLDSGTTVVYLGAQTDTAKPIRAFDFSGETRDDFVSIGS